MAFSALFRRLSSRISRSRADANSNYIFALRRMISSLQPAPAPAQAPWLMIRPNCGSDGDLIYRFYCFAKDKIYNFIPKEEDMVPWEGGMNIIRSYVRLVGSSQGWLALYDRRNRDLFLSDPTTYQHLKLPAVDAMGEGEVQSIVILDEKEEGKVIMTFGSSNRLAICSPRRGHGWNLFGGGEYESVVYSTAHRRLLCLTSTLKLEAWDVGGESPILDRVTQLEKPDPRKPTRPDLKTLDYIVCHEQSRQLLVVVRHVSTRGGSQVSTGRFVVGKYVCPSVDFEVYKIDDGDGGGMMMTMEDSLEGMAIFVGINPPIAIRDVAGIKPGSIYFTDDNRALRIFEGDVIANDVGIFDHNKGVAVALQDNGSYEDSVWFAPH